MLIWSSWVAYCQFKSKQPGRFFYWWIGCLDCGMLLDCYSCVLCDAGIIRPLHLFSPDHFQWFSERGCGRHAGRARVAVERGVDLGIWRSLSQWVKDFAAYAFFLDILIVCLHSDYYVVTTFSWKNKKNTFGRRFVLTSCKSFELLQEVKAAASPLRSLGRPEVVFGFLITTCEHRNSKEIRLYDKRV
jgi:hypothetical protein